MTGRPKTVLNRGRRVVEDGALMGQPGDGRFIARDPVDLTGFAGTHTPELNPATNFGADIAP